MFFLLSWTTFAGPNDNLDGYAWSSNVGWISFNCENVNCDSSNYGVDLGIDENGYRYFTGYAWSSNIGWISFNESDVSGCPDGGPCRPRINTATGLGEGWAKILSGQNDPDDGWEGWLKIGGETTGGTPYSPVFVDSDHFEGWSWGGENDLEGAPLGIIGWISWSCIDRGVCDSGSNYQVKLKTVTISVVTSGGGTVLSGDPEGQINCGSDCEGQYQVDTQVTLTAYPDPGHVFGGWVNCSPADTAECTVLADFNKTVQASFPPANLYLGTRFVDDGDSGIVVEGEGGTVTESSQGIECGDSLCEYSVDSGTQLDLLATPDLGYVFVRWFNPDGPTIPCADVEANPCSFIKADSNETAKAQFRKTQCNNGREDEDPPVGDGIDGADLQCFDPDDDNETENEYPYSDNCPADGPGDCPACNDGIDNEAELDGYIDYQGFCSGAPNATDEDACNIAENEDTPTTWYPADPGCRGSRYRTTESAIDNRVREF